MPPRNKLLIQVTLVMFFACVHFSLASTGAGKYNLDSPSWQDLLHLSVMSSTTIGFGDIYPVNFAARAVTWSHAFSMVYVSLFL